MEKLRVTPLYEASYDGNLDEMRKLLSNGADVNGKNYVENYSGWGDEWDYEESKLAPIYGAIYSGNPSAVQLLIDHKANLNQEGNRCFDMYPLISAGRALSQVFQYVAPIPYTPSFPSKPGDPPINQKELDEYMLKKEKLDREGVYPPEWKEKVAKEQAQRNIIGLLIVNGAYEGFDDIAYKKESEKYYARGASYSPTRGLTSYVIEQGDGAICFLDQLFKYRKQLIVKGHIPVSSEAYDDTNFILRMISHCKHGIISSSWGSYQYIKPIKNVHLLQILFDIVAGKISIDDITKAYVAYKASTNKTEMLVLYKQSFLPSR
jgi:hypothetical protein